MLGGCGSHTWWNPPLTAGSNPNLPVGTGVNMGRVMGDGVAVSPLTTEPGDIWPGPLPPPKTLREMERQPIAGAPGKGGATDRAGNSLLAPLPYGTPGVPAPAAGAAAPRAAPVPAQPPVDRRIIVPNGNGTSTVIHPDGRIETIPTPK